MHDEDGFLSAIRQTPADDVARLVFADWLDKQDDPTCKLKAEFIRLELRMAEETEKSLNHYFNLSRLQRLAARLDPLWLAVVSHLKIEACNSQFSFECPKQWEKLTPTSDVKIRVCERCKKNVHYCGTLHEAQNHVANDTRVALTIALERRLEDLLPPPPEFRLWVGRGKPRQSKKGRIRHRNIQRENWEEME